MNTWHLSTQADMRTGHPLVYPVSTVIVVPATAPKNVTYIVDNGIVPLVLANGSLLNMGQNWRSTESGLGLDVTGNNASAFVVSNLADHDVFFAKVPYAQMTADSEYWIVPQSRKVLFWQNGPYWSVDPTRVWSASLLPKNTDDDFAACIAETMMYRVLGQENPI